MNSVQQTTLARLSSGRIEYIAHSAVGTSRVMVEFAGIFEEHPVLWKAVIVALITERSEHSSQYIDIKTNKLDEETRRSVEIGLQVATIDEPTIIKAIKMMRQYKNLRRGRHEFSGRNK